LCAQSLAISTRQVSTEFLFNEATSRMLASLRCTQAHGAYHVAPWLDDEFAASKHWQRQTATQGKKAALLAAGTEFVSWDRSTTLWAMKW
jgi:hypothetical protein